MPGTKKADRLREAGTAAEEDHGDGEVGAAESGCGAEEVWIEFELLDPEGEPIPFVDEKITIILPDGTERREAFDGKGLIRIDKGLDPGLCTVLFPAEYLDAKGRHRPVLGEDETDEDLLEDKNSIEIELLDEEGNALPNEKYRIEIEGQKPIEGVLDDNGCAIRKGIKARECHVTFPEIDPYFEKVE